MRKRNIRLAITIVIIFLGTGAAALANENSAGNHNHESDFSVFTLIEALGICALVSLLITFLTGLFRRKLGRRFLIVHRFFAWLTVILALSHGITVMIVF